MQRMFLIIGGLVTLIILLMSTQGVALAKQISGSGIAPLAVLPFVCPGSGVQEGTFTLKFDAKSQGGHWSGTMIITSDQSLTKEGIINDVKMSKTAEGKPIQYQVTGIESVDSICAGPVPTTFTISGYCGASATFPIDFRAENGEAAVFSHMPVVKC